MLLLLFQLVDGLANLAIKFGQNYDKWLNLICANNKEINPKSKTQLTLTHGDFRAENMFFDAPTSLNKDGSSSSSTGESKDGSATGQSDQSGQSQLGMRLIDFQLMKESSGPAELAYFIGTSMTIKDRQQYEISLIQLYYDEMKRNGSSITMTQMLMEYQAGLATSLIIYTIAQKDTQMNSERAKKLIRVCQQRLWSHIQDWGYEQAMDKIWAMELNEVIGRDWSDQELKEIIPLKYFELL